MSRTTGIPKLRLHNLKKYLGLCLLIGTVIILSMFQVMSKWQTSDYKEGVYLLRLDEGLAYSGEIIKSSLDRKTYSTKQLPNGLRFVVISDPNTEIAAVSCDIGVGSFQDPPHIPGLAHLLEHAIFLGDKLHPAENSFEEFLGQHNGHSNAFTSQENTNYYFKINPDVLEESLERFSALLSTPLLKEESSRREYHALESEFQKDKLVSVRRVWRLLKHLADFDHPFHRLSPGNFNTLNTSNTHEELIKFFKQHYSPNKIKCVILGREDVQDLTKTAEKFFGSMVKHSKWSVTNTVKVSPVEPYSENVFGQIVKYKPLREGNDLDMMWPLSGPFRCGVGSVSRLLAKSYPRSILTVLKRRGWATDVSWSILTSTSKFSVLRVNVKLTQLGADTIKEVVKVVFAQIHLHKTESQNVLRGRLSKLHQESLQAFINSANEQDVHHYVKTIAARMNRVVHPAYFLGAPLQACSVSCYIKTLMYLHPDNCIIMFGTNNITDAILINIEPWYNIPYSLRKLEVHELDILLNVQKNYGLSLAPSPKMFIAKPFPLYESDIELDSWPSLIYTDGLMNVWWQQDFTFHVPRTDIVLWVYQSQEHNTPQEVALNYLLVIMIRDQLSEQILSTGYQIEIRYQSNSGFVVFISGYSSHYEIVKCVRALVNVVIRLDLSQTQRYTGVVRYLAHTELTKSRFAEAYKHPLFKSRVILEKNVVPIDDVINALDLISLKRFSKFYRSFLLKVGIRCLIYGNVLRNMAHQYALELTTIVMHKSMVISPPFHPTIQLEKGTYVLRANYPNDKETASVADITFVLGPTTWNSDNIQTEYDLYTRSVLAQIVTTLLQEPAFTELRTKQQLGYSVFTKYLSHFGIDYIHLCVQGSSGHSAVQMANSILEFLKYSRLTLNELLIVDDESKWSDILQSVKEKLLAKPKSQTEMLVKLANELFSPDPDPNRADMFVGALEHLTADDVIKFYDDYIIGNESRKIILLSQPDTKSTLKDLDTINEQSKELNIVSDTMQSAVFLYWHFTFLGIEIGV